MSYFKILVILLCSHVFLYAQTKYPVDRWTRYHGKIPTFSLFELKKDFTNEKSNKFCLKRCGNGYLCDKVVSDLIKIKPNVTYVAGFSMKTESWPPPNIYFIVRFYDKNKNYIKMDTIHSSRWSNSKKSVWEKSSIILKTPCHARFLKLSLSNYNHEKTEIAPVWITDVYVSESMEKALQTKKRSFNGSLTQVDEKGNVLIFKHGKWQPFFPLCIYSDKSRDMMIYSKQGFNCIAWTSSANSIARAARAVSKFNPDGMMAAFDIHNYVNPSKKDSYPRKKLVDKITEIKEKGLMDHLLWYYWDNEHMYTAYEYPKKTIELIKTLDVNEKGKRMHPIYALNGNIGIARKYNDMIDLTGTYIVGSKEKKNEVSNKFLTMQTIENLEVPVVVAQINLGLTPDNGVGKRMRAFVYKAIAQGAKAIGYWRDRCPNNPEYQNIFGNVKKEYVHGDITKQSWWDDFPNIRQEIDRMMSDGVIQASSASSWKATTVFDDVTIGTKETKDGRKYLIVVNMSDKERSIDIQLEGIEKGIDTAVEYFTGQKFPVGEDDKFTVKISGWNEMVIQLVHRFSMFSATTDAGNSK